MSHPTGKSLKQARIDRTLPVERVPYATYLMRKILNWSRLARIVTISIFGIALTAAVFPLVDIIYIDRFFNPDTRILPSFISAALGIIMYIVGWFLIVGTRGEKPPERIGVIIYTLVGTVIILFVLFMIINGYHLATLPDA
jgi:hypothetical protein